jgi:hypothetical protein
MIRLEIIANHSIEENILEALHEQEVGTYYTHIPGAFGVGSSGSRMGDAIWPEENFILIIWCEKEEAEAIERAIAPVKERFPAEGIKIFKLGDTPPQVVYLPVPTEASAPAVPPPPPSARKVPIYRGPEGENS